MPSPFPVRFAKAEGWSLLFFATLESCILALCWLYRLHAPHSAISYLLAQGYFWKLMAACGGAVALLFGGPCYLVCKRWMKSKRWPLLLAGAVITIGSLLLFALVVIDGLHDGCGG